MEDNHFHFMVYIEYYIFESIFSVKLFKILNDVIVCIMLDLKNKILIYRKIDSFSSEMKRILFHKVFHL